MPSPPDVTISKRDAQTVQIKVAPFQSQFQKYIVYRANVSADVTSAYMPVQEFTNTNLGDFAQADFTDSDLKATFLASYYIRVAGVTPQGVEETLSSLTGLLVPAPATSVLGDFNPERHTTMSLVYDPSLRRAVPQMAPETVYESTTTNFVDGTSDVILDPRDRVNEITLDLYSEGGLGSYTVEITDSSNSGTFLPVSSVSIGEHANTTLLVTPEQTVKITTTGTASNKTLVARRDYLA